MTACAHNTVSKTRKEKEAIHALLAQPSEKSIYAVGELYDYQIHCDEKCQSTFRFLNQKNIRNNIIRIRLNPFQISEGEKKDVDIDFTIELLLTPKQAAVLAKHDISSLIKFNSDDEDIKKATEGTAKELAEFSGRVLDFDKLYLVQINNRGRPVRLSNRDEILQKYRLAKPIPATVTIKAQKKYGIGRTLRDIVLLPIGVPLAGAWAIVATTALVIDNPVK